MAVDLPGSANDTARLLSEALAELGSGATAEGVVERVRRFDRGLAAEDELAVILGWLGRCSIVHKLDQRTNPVGASDRYVVPDLSANFNHRDREVALLIEVKTSDKARLSWRRDYYTRLRAYGKTAGLPVAVAWRYRGLWTLVDLETFSLARTNYRLDLITALQENLMGVLGGDFMYRMAKGVGFHFELRREEVLNEDGSEQIWRARVEDAYLTDGKGRRRKAIGMPLFWLLGAANPADESTGGGGRVTQSFTIHEESGGQFIHRALVSLLRLHGGADRDVNWRHLLGREVPTFGRNELRKAAEAGIRDNFVSYIFDVVPANMPAFLS